MRKLVGLPSAADESFDRQLHPSLSSCYCGRPSFGKEVDSLVLHSKELSKLGGRHSKQQLSELCFRAEATWGLCV